MELSVTEQLMYRAMQAIYQSNIPVSFKGSMVLKACLLQAGFTQETRHTFDIDANWNSSTAPTMEQMAQSFEKALVQYNMELSVAPSRQYGIGRSAGFEFADKQSGEVLFTMDIDVNRPAPATKLYSIDNFCFIGATPEQIIADKLLAISSEKIFRRMKDVIDLYYLSQVCTFSKNNILQIIHTSGRNLGTFHSFLHELDKLQHAYEKFQFTADLPKPQFWEIYSKAKTYIVEVLPV